MIECACIPKHIQWLDIATIFQLACSSGDTLGNGCEEACKA